MLIFYSHSYWKVVVSCNHTSQNCSVLINIMHQIIVKGQSNPSWPRSSPACFCQAQPSSSSSWAEFSLISKLSSHPARPARPTRPDPTGKVNFWAIDQPVLDAIQPQSSLAKLQPIWTEINHISTLSSDG